MMLRSRHFISVTNPLPEWTGTRTRIIAVVLNIVFAYLGHFDSPKMCSKLTPCIKHFAIKCREKWPLGLLNPLQVKTQTSLKFS